MAQLMDLVGQRFGRYVVIARGPNEPRRDARWVCRCDCGTETTVRGRTLRSGESRSCGCLRADFRVKNSTRHGLYGTDISRIWRGMRQRCLNPRNPAYPRYGGRGITICERWSDILAFAEDMGPRPSLSHEVDRVDNDGPYSPENCRWATATEQGNNKRNNRIVSAHGETHTVAEWSRLIGIQANTIAHRLDSGWEPERALIPRLRPFRRPDLAHGPDGRFLATLRAERFAP